MPEQIDLVAWIDGVRGVVRPAPVVLPPLPRKRHRSTTWRAEILARVAELEAERQRLDTLLADLRRLMPL